MWHLLLSVKDKPRPALRLLVLEVFWVQARYLFACALGLMLPLPFNIAIVGALTVCVFGASLILAIFRVVREGTGVQGLLIPKPIPMVMLALFSLYLLGMAWAIMPEEAGFGVEKKLSFLALPLAFMLAPSGKRLADSVVFSFVVGMIYIVLSTWSLAVLRYSVEPHAYLFFSEGALYPLELHHAYISIYGLFAVVALLVGGKRWGPTWLWGGLAIVLAAFSAMMASRTGLALMVGLALGYAYLQTMRGHAMRGALFIVLCGAVLLGLWQVPYVRQTMAHAKIGRQIPKPEDVTDADGVATRYYIWKANLALAARVPWYGLGTNSTINAQLAQYKAEHFTSNHYNAHNQYLQTYLELGWAGLLCLCLLFGLAIWGGIVGGVPMLAAIGILSAAACVTEAWLEAHKGVVFIALFLSMYGSIGWKTNVNE